MSEMDPSETNPEIKDDADPEKIRIEKDPGYVAKTMVKNIFIVDFRGVEKNINNYTLYYPFGEEVDPRLSLELRDGDLIIRERRAGKSHMISYGAFIEGELEAGSKLDGLSFCDAVCRWITNPKYVRDIKIIWDIDAETLSNYFDALADYLHSCESA